MYHLTSGCRSIMEGLIAEEDSKCLKCSLMEGGYSADMILFLSFRYFELGRGDLVTGVMSP